jgi:hypothetical protein
VPGSYVAPRSDEFGVARCIYAALAVGGSAAARPVFSFDPVEGEVTKVPIEKMARDKLTYRYVIDVDQRKPIFTNAENIDDRDGKLFECTKDFLTLDASDYGVTLPVP